MEDESISRSAKYLKGLIPPREGEELTTEDREQLTQLLRQPALIKLLRNLALIVEALPGTLVKNPNERQAGRVEGVEYALQYIVQSLDVEDEEDGS